MGRHKIFNIVCSFIIWNNCNNINVYSGKKNILPNLELYVFISLAYGGIFSTSSGSPLPIYIQLFSSYNWNRSFTFVKYLLLKFNKVITIWNK